MLIVKVNMVVVILMMIVNLKREYW